MSRAQKLSAPEQEPVAIRYDFDGYGWQYIDSGSGSNWRERVKHLDAEPLYTAAPQPTGLEGAKQLAKLNGEIAADLKGEVLQLRALIEKVHTAKGRHHTQIAMCDLFDAVGLANVRPAKVDRKRPDDTEGGAL